MMLKANTTGQCLLSFDRISFEIFFLNTAIEFAQIFAQRKALITYEVFKNGLVVDNPEHEQAMTTKEINMAIEMESRIDKEQKLYETNQSLEKKGTNLNHSCYLEEELVVDNPDDESDCYPTYSDMWPSDEEPSWLSDTKSDEM